MSLRKKRRPPFPGLRLTARDRRVLAEKTAPRRELAARTWKRIRMLELLHEGMSIADTAKAVGTYPREVRRVGWRFLERDVEEALRDDPRPHPPRKLDSRQEAAIVAMVCAAPPEGCARWTVVLVAEESMRRGIVARVGRETVRQVLANHDLKPWREKNVVRSKARR